jgi:hypothetical protein
MYGAGHVAGEFTMLHPDLITAGISYSWGWWTMPSEVERPLDAENIAPEFYLVLGLRDFTHHITTVRDTYERVKNKGYRIIYREFEELGDRSYHPTSNDDSLRWATRLRNKTIPLSPTELNLLKAPVLVSGYYPTLALVGGVCRRRRKPSSNDAAVRAAAPKRNHGIGEATTASPQATTRHREWLSGFCRPYANWRSPPLSRR